ncbi:uncharacterized protein L3040_002422 [Drepanopeziza brunnea f. sp. 'multigermtubi']|nr:hypothetical protein L3040_002422 [Drepanopeziza brunnea f. sp. 'multigermtubi']
MKSIPENIYPDYCHSLSPTIGKWCPLQATDVHRLRDVGMFSDGRVLYHLGNHPVKWVRITGVVVAMDQYPGKRVYVVDDSSGMNIECAAAAPVSSPINEAPAVPKHLDQIASLMAAKPSNAPPKKPERMKETQGEEKNTSPSVQTPMVPWDEIDVGMVVKVKGRVNSRWDIIQIEVVKVEVMRCTDQEVRCWNEIMAFKRDVSDRPWVVSKEQEEKCRRLKERELRGSKNGGRRAESREQRKKRKDDEKKAAERREERKESVKRKRDDERTRKRTKAGYPSTAVMKVAAGHHAAVGI